MCSNTDLDHDGIILMEHAEELNQISKACRKCGDKTQVQVVLRKKDAYCKSCFLYSTTHKFRACLGKSKTMRPGDKVLIAFSGSSNSVALLHLIQSGLQETSHKKLMFNPFIAYIDETSSLNLAAEECSKVRQNICTVLETYGYPKYIVPLELTLESDETVNAYLVEGSCRMDKSHFKDLLGSLLDSTSKIDVQNKLRNNLLAQVAKSLGCDKLFTAETADDLAMKLITNVSLGRGAQLPYDVGFLDDRHPELKVIRPLRNLSRKELVFYNVFHSLPSIHVPSLLTKADPYSSIQKLTESFLCDLQGGFPSTLSTVFRVADKLTTNAGDTNICPLCKAPIDADSTAPSSLRATQFSRLVSSLGPSSFDTCNLTDAPSGSDCCSNKASSNCSKVALEPILQDMLCYSCNIIFRDTDLSNFPSHVRQRLEELNQRHKMKKEIEDFLL